MISSLKLSFGKQRLKVSKESQYKRYTRSKVGNFFYVLFLVAFGAFSVLPLIYCIATSFKPLDELLVFPPRFFVMRPTISNYLALPGLLSNLQVPLGRYVFNSLFVTIVSTFLYVFIASLAAFALCKGKIKGKKVIFLVIQFALLFNAYTLGIPRYLIYSWFKLVDTYWVMILPYIASTMCFPYETVYGGRHSRRSA